MNKTILLVASTFLFATILEAQTIITADSVAGNWSAGASPYIITRDLQVPGDTSLIIEPGTKILFAGNFVLNVRGKLVAKGSKRERIVFAFADSSLIDRCKVRCDTNVDQLDGWKGIRFMNDRTEHDTSLLELCSISGVKALSGISTECTGGGISISGQGMVVIKNCMIYNNQAHLGAAIYCENSNPIIEGNLIEKNQSLSNGGAFYLFNSHPLVKNNLIRLNTSPEFGGAFYCEKTGGLFINNTISENSARFGGAISMISSDIQMINNTIAENNATVNGGGVHCIESEPIIENSIVWGNRSVEKGRQLYLYEHGYPEISYSNIQGGLYGIDRYSDSLNVIRQFSGNMDYDPEFVKDDTAYYALGKFSPCIDAGFNKSQLDFDTLDMIGRPRIVNNIIDMGAQEFSITKDNEKNIQKENKEKLMNVQELSSVIYPNPNKGKFTIEATGSGLDVSSLVIVNTNGQVVHSQDLNIDNDVVRKLVELDIPCGLYFIELKNSTGQIIKREKMIIQ